MSEVLGLAIAFVASVLLVKWIFSTHKHSLTLIPTPCTILDANHNDTSQEQKVSQLQQMFPELPSGVLKECLRSSGGCVDVAVERLLQYPPPLPQESGASQTRRAPTTTTAETTRLKDDSGVNKSEADPQASGAQPRIAIENINRQQWAQDQTLRQRILAQRKLDLINRARTQATSPSSPPIDRSDGGS